MHGAQCTAYTIIKRAFIKIPNTGNRFLYSLQLTLFYIIGYFLCRFLSFCLFLNLYRFIQNSMQNICNLHVKIFFHLENTRELLTK